MKYIKLFESYSDIESICKKYDIENYIINSDGSIDVNGNVILNSNNLTKLPLKFRNVSGSFNCSDNQLTTLEGAPESVGHFKCSYNKLTSLIGCPQSVSGYFDCSNNQLTSLEGAPKTVAGLFGCSLNELTTLEGAPESVGGDFYFRSNKLTNFIGFPEDFDGDLYLGGNPVEEIYNLFKTDKCVKWLNEFDAIQGDKIVLDRLEMVYDQLGMEIPDNIKLTNYEII